MCLPAILGWLGACASAPEPDAWGIALGKIGDINQVRCPALAKADTTMLKTATPRPAQWPEKGASRGAMQAHIDHLEANEQRKISAASRVINEHVRCRGGDSSAKTS